MNEQEFEEPSEEDFLQPINEPVPNTNMEIAKNLLLAACFFLVVGILLLLTAFVTVL